MDEAVRGRTCVPARYTCTCAFTCVRRKVNKFSPSYSYRIVVHPSLSHSLSRFSPRAPFHTRTRAHVPQGQVLKLLSGFRPARQPARPSRRATYTVVNLAPCKIGHYCPLLRIVYQCAQGSTYVTARECIQVQQFPSVQDASASRRRQLNFSSPLRVESGTWTRVSNVSRKLVCPPRHCDRMFS